MNRLASALYLGWIVLALVGLCVACVPDRTNQGGSIEEKVIEKEPTPGPIITVDPQPDPNGNHFRVDGQPTIDGSPGGCTLNPIAFGNVHMFKVVYKVGEQEVSRDLKSFGAKFAGKSLTVSRSSDNPPQFVWNFECGTMTPGSTTEYPSTYSWHPDLRKTIDAGTLNPVLVPGQSPPNGATLLRIEIQRSS